MDRGGFPTIARAATACAVAYNGFLVCETFLGPWPLAAELPS